MKSWMRMFVLFIVWVLPGFGFAQTGDKTDESLTTMEEIVVTGTRFEQRTEKIPAHVTVITADQIKASGAQSVPDVLRNLGGVLVTDLNGNGNNQTIDMGGFGETANRHVAVVINGRRINSIDQSNITWGTIPMENIERIEVLRGSGSVLYGDNAIGGVINIITKDAEKGLHFNSELGIGTDDLFKGTAAVDYTKDKIGLRLGATYFETDGYRDRTKAERKSVYGKFTYDATDTISFFSEATTSESEYQLPGGLTEAQMNQDRKQAVNQSDDGENNDDSIIIGFEADTRDYGLFTANLNYRNEERFGNMDSWNFPLLGWYGYYTYEEETIGFAGQYILDNKLINHNNRLTLGVDIYDTDYDAWGGAFKEDKSQNSYDHDRETFGYYIQDEFNIIDSLLVNIGVRYEDPETTLRSNIAGAVPEYQIDNSEWAWNIGLAYNFCPGSKVYARVYRAFRYPVVDEYMVLSTGAVNTGLGQEKSQGYEIGLKYSLLSRFDINLSLYHFDMEDEISWNNTTLQNENLDETVHQGAEIDLQFKAVEWLTLYGNAGYTNAEMDSGANNGNDIPLVPEWKGNAGLELSLESSFRYRLQCNYVDNKYRGGDFTNTAPKMDSHTTVDMYASYRYKFMELFLNATNVFDEEYCDYNYFGSYYPMPEAVYYGGIKFKM